MALRVAIKVEVEFTAGVWTDLSSRCRSASFRRGRSHELAQVSAGRGTVRLDNRDRALDPTNTASAYSPNVKPGKAVRISMVYGGTTYRRFTGKITGWPQSYAAKDDAYVDATIVDAFDNLARARLRSPWAQAITDLNPRNWWRLGESAGTAAVDSGSAGVHGTYQGGATFAARSGLVDGDDNGAIEFTANQSVTIPAGTGATAFPFTIIGWFRPNRLTCTSTGDQRAYLFAQSNDSGRGRIGIYYTRENTAGLPLATDRQVFFEVMSATATRSDRATPDGVTGELAEGTTYMVVAVANSTSDLDLYVNAVVGANWDAGSPVVQNTGDITLATDRSYVDFDGTADEVIVLNGTALTSAQVSSLYALGTDPWQADTPAARMARVLDAVGWSASARDVDTGSAELVEADVDGASALEHLHAVAETDGGRFFIDRNGNVTFVGRSEMWTESVYITSQATLGDAAGAIPVSRRTVEEFGYDEDDVATEVRIARPNRSPMLATTGATEVTTVSLSSLETRAPYVQAQADWVLAERDEPRLRINELVLQPERSPAAMYPVLLASELGYRYTVVRTPPAGGDQISEEGQLEQIAEAWTPDSYEHRWELSPAVTRVWTWDTWGLWEDDTEPMVWSY